MHDVHIPDGQVEHKFDEHFVHVIVGSVAELYVPIGQY
jgi:hypothetical protein